jgi:hypothetical protein
VKKENIFSAPVTIVSRRVIDDVKRFFSQTTQNTRRHLKTNRDRRKKKGRKEKKK